MKPESFLEMLNAYPIAGALMVLMLIIVHQIIRVWKGKDNASITRIEQENNKLAKQTSEVVNTCAARTAALMEAIEKYMAANDVGQIRAEHAKTLRMLEALGHDTGLVKGALADLDRVCNGIKSDIVRADSRVVHASIINKVEHMQSVIDDIKRVAISIAEKK